MSAESNTRERPLSYAAVIYLLQLYGLMNGVASQVEPHSIQQAGQPFPVDAVTRMTYQTTLNSGREFHRRGH